MFPDFKIGIGTWAWGNQLIWGYNETFQDTDLHEAFQQAIINETPFFFSSETFADGESERILGRLSAECTQRIYVSSKFAPRFWRLRRSDFVAALKKSLTRLNRTAIDLYQIYPTQSRLKMRLTAECMAEAVDSGFVHQVGVSNFSLDQIERFREDLGHFGIDIAYLETPYSILERTIETNGIYEYCRSNDIRILAQSPLAMGLLSNEPNQTGYRTLFTKKFPERKVSALLRLLQQISSECDGKTSVQIALRWLIQKDVIPIPGSVHATHILENVQTLNWKLPPQTVALIDQFETK